MKGRKVRALHGVELEELKYIKYNGRDQPLGREEEAKREETA